MTTLSMHVLDTSRGRPAAGVRASLYGGVGGELLADRRTDADGRISGLSLVIESDMRADEHSDEHPDEHSDKYGEYWLVFDTGEYFRAQGVEEFFYAEVVIAFRAPARAGHYHVPLMLSPFGYSTCRGS